MISVGVDLAGSAKRPTGLCALSDKLVAEYSTVYEDSEIIKFIEDVKPNVVAIDAPLSLPKGRKSINDRTGPHLRKCDEELLKLRIKFFPITLGPMRKLTERGIRLANELKLIGFKVIEVYPGAAQDVLSISRKSNLDSLRKGLLKLKIRGEIEKANEHELDAITAALVGLMFLESKAVALGDPEEGLLYIPGVPQRLL
jgi:predicted nuclease with RNAse H fold